MWQELLQEQRLVPESLRGTRAKGKRRPPRTGVDWVDCSGPDDIFFAGTELLGCCKVRCFLDFAIDLEMPF